MKKEELKIITSISIAFAAVLTLAYLAMNSKTFDIPTIYRGISFSITIVTLFWTFYFSYGWKICLLNKIFYRPNLNGTWSGTLISDWKDENGTPVPPIDFLIVVRQSFIRIHFTTFTESFVGLSYAETFSLDKETGLKNIAFLYRKDTSQSNDDILKEGATELRLILFKNDKRMEGKYWSNTKTQGIINVCFVNDKHVDSFQDANQLKRTYEI